MSFVLKNKFGIMTQITLNQNQDTRMSLTMAGFGLTMAGNERNPA